MDQVEISRRVRERFGDRILRSAEHRGQACVTVRPQDLRDVLLWLRDDPELDFNMLMDLGGVDYLTYPNPDGEDEDDEGERLYGGRPWRFEVAYQMYSLSKNHRFRVKVAVKDDKVEVPTVWDLWRVANWMEREVYDLFGVRFSGHPNLRRILCHEDFVGHALRKDYPINRRQTLTRPIEYLLTDDPEWA